MLRQIGLPAWWSGALCVSVLDLAAAAGEAIVAVRRAGLKPDDVARKDDQSPVTLADRRAHELITAGLSRLTPSVPVVSEESVESQAHRLPTGCFWLIDPLDGTREFVAGRDDYTVNIALIVQGQATFGVVHAPASGACHWGGVGWGAWRRHAGGVEALQPSVPPWSGKRRWRVVASRSHLDPATRAFIDSLGAHELVQAGSSLKFCRVAEGVADVYPRLGPTCEWDTAAGQAVLEAAGGCVLTMQGEALRYGRPEVLNPHFIAYAAPPPGRAGA